MKKPPSILKYKHLGISTQNAHVVFLKDVKDKNVIVVCTLHEPNAKLLPLYFLINTIQSLGVKNVSGQNSFKLCYDSK